MAHHEGEATAIERVMEVLSGHGLEGMAKAVTLPPRNALDRGFWTKPVASH